MALQLKRMGLDARPLAGGYSAWRKLYPVEPKSDDPGSLSQGRLAG